MSRIIFRGEKMKIRLTQEEVDILTEKALIKTEKFNRISPDETSPYGFNHIHSHLVGLVAEKASHILFTEIEKMLGINLNIDAAYDDERREGECDLYVGGIRIEVKGIKYGSWLRYGPCISSRQLPKVQRKADVVLWALYNERVHELTFEGYTVVPEIPAIEPLMTGREGNMIPNYPVMSIMKPLETLKFAA